MKLEEGMYVRTDYGKIGKIIYFEGTMAKTDNPKIITFKDFNEEIKKASHNIIDLIEEGDYVNGHKVTRVSGTRYDDNDLYCWCDESWDKDNQCIIGISTKDIKSIVTKEQFEAIKYEVE